MVRMLHQGFVLLVALCCFFCCGILATEDTEQNLRDLPCPPANDIVPCVCTVLPDGEMEMDCSSVTSNSQLASIFSETVFSFKDFESFIMDSNYYLTSIKAGDLGVGITFKTIKIIYGSLNTIENNAFMNSYNTLTHLEIREANLFSFPFNEIVRFTQLITLNLEGNQLFGFPVIGSTTLQYLYLEENLNIGQISQTSLANLPSLKEVALWSTGIGYISPGTDILVMYEYIWTEKSMVQ